MCEPEPDDAVLLVPACELEFEATAVDPVSVRSIVLAPRARVTAFGVVSCVVCWLFFGRPSRAPSSSPRLRFEPTP